MVDGSELGVKERREGRNRDCSQHRSHMALTRRKANCCQMVKSQFWEDFKILIEVTRLNVNE